MNPKRIGNCIHCASSTEFLLTVQIFANGSENFIWKCSQCNTSNPDRSLQFFIPSEKVRESFTREQIDALAHVFPDFYTRCVRCGNRTAELHHWAPRAIFGVKECENWPKDYLCKSCHDLWHQMVTPQLVK